MWLKIGSMRLFIKNIQQLVGTHHEDQRLVAGEEMNQLPIIEKAFLAIEDGRIVAFGEMADWPGITDWRDLEVIDAEGKCVLPLWCDSHTHTVFAGTREGEFVDRINGLSYEEIAQRGGGILNSAAQMAKMSEEQLYSEALQRAKQLISMGTGALEIKSGYGLSPETELKMLRVIKKLKAHLPIPIKATFLGAHALPPEYQGRRKEYVQLMMEEVLPKAIEEGLVDYVDIFTEEGYFDLEDTKAVLEAGEKHGLKAKIHVNQFNAIGGVKLAVDHGALSVDHLEVLEEADIEALKGSNTIPVALPSCSFFLGIPYTPVKPLMEAGLPIALATDYNPGSTPSGNMNFVVSLACIQMKMTPEAAVNAATLNGAAAMELSHEVGSISIGKRANFMITKPMKTFHLMPYAFGDHHIESVFVNGSPFV